MSEKYEYKNVNFIDLLNDVKDNKVLLPDFQRGFKWNITKQKALICSVLSRFPLGSLLMLEGEHRSFGCKPIGSTGNYITCNDTEKGEKVSFLLDGQQRLTVLTNVFSPIITEKGKDIYSNLKRVFFFKIPKWNKVYDFEKCERKSIDLFSLYNLSFEPKKEQLPKFTTDEIEENIICDEYSKKYDISEIYKTQEENLSNDFILPKNPLNDCYYIPLFLVSEVSLHYGNLIQPINDNFYDKLTEAIQGEILQYVIQNLGEDKKIQQLIKELYPDPDQENTATIIKKYIKELSDGGILQNKEDEIKDKVADKLKERVRGWTQKLRSYMYDSCLSNMNITKMELKEEQSNRAISIFANMNQTSVSLNEFDLLVAHVALCMQQKKSYMQQNGYDATNYADFVKECFGKSSEYNIQTVLKDKNNIEKPLRSKLGASENEFGKALAKHFSLLKGVMNNRGTKITDDEENENNDVIKDDDLDSTIKQTILKLLNLSIHKSDFNYSYLPNDLGGTKGVRDLEPQEILSATPKVCVAIMRALLFFLCRCGINSIKSINYKQHLYLVSAFFLNDKWYNNNEIHKVLELWYWVSVFSGIYNADQKAHTLGDMQGIYKIIKKLEDDKEPKWNANDDAIEWLVYRGKLCFNNDLSNKEFLLMEKKGSFPKINYRDFVCQFYLSKRYLRFFVNNGEDQFTDVFTEKLEAHHIIPLNTARNYNASEENLRNEKSHYLNSPLNFIYITEKENKFIGGKDYESYIKKINKEALKDVGLSAFCENNNKEDPEAITKKILENRLEDIKGSINKKYKELFNLDLDNNQKI